MNKPINLQSKFELFSEHWSPKVIAELNVKPSRFSKKNPYGIALENLYNVMITEIKKF